MSSKFKVQSSKLKTVCETPISKWSFAILFFAFGFFGLQPSALLAQDVHPIAEIQSDKDLSPFENKLVRTSGIVTARTKTGFFIQTPDDKIDKNPNSSEGIFVYTKTEPPGEAAIGNAVTINGYVNEFRPKQEPLSLPVTEISMRKTDTVQVDSKNNPLPKPLVLTVDDFKSNQINELEKYEGMRVIVPLMTVIAPTGGRVDEDKTEIAVSNGTFYGVVKGLPRPFREPGLEIYDYALLPDKDKNDIKKNYPKIKLFDDNPERLRVESAGQLGAQTIDVTANAEIKNLTGVMHYSYRTFTILVDADNKPEISNLMKAKPLPAPNERQFSIAGMNLENFFDDQDDPSIKEPIVTAEAFERRLKKVSMAVRDVLQTPDIIGVVEMENLDVLKKLGERINKDAEAAGKPNPKYEAYLIDGNDGRGIDVGFLVKSSRVKVLETKQYGKDEKYPNPTSNDDVFLNDRPPLMIRAAINDPKTNQPFEFTVIVNHLKSLRGYDNPKEQDNVRTKKRLQAEFLAKIVQDRIKADPNEKIALIGDFNAFQFDDGITDVIGTIKGKPLGKDEVFNSSPDLLNPDLTDLVDTIKPGAQYSYTYDGNAQVIDHFLVNDNFKKFNVAFGYGRVDADYPEIYRNDANRLERYSDHDPSIAFFSFDAKPQ